MVFGDIGTSPLYTLKTVLSLAGDKPDAFTVLGSLSMGQLLSIIMLAAGSLFLGVAVRTSAARDKPNTPI